MKRHGIKYYSFRQWKEACVLTITLLLVSALPAGASVVYTGLGSGYILQDLEYYGMDIDVNGEDDIFFFHNNSTAGTFDTSFIYGYPTTHGNKPYAAYGGYNQYGNNLLKALPYGEEIGSSQQWVTGVDYVFLGLALSDMSIALGEWKDMPDDRAYFGFSFFSTTDNDWHYGYVDMKIDYANALETTIYGYAWENEANTAILAGDTGSPVPVPAAVWLMGSGLLGLIGFRKKKN